MEVVIEWLANIRIGHRNTKRNNTNRRREHTEKNQKKEKSMTTSYSFLWSHLGLNQGPPDYESGATNQLSYRTSSEFACRNDCRCAALGDRDSSS